LTKWQLGDVEREQISVIGGNLFALGIRPFLERMEGERMFRGTGAKKGGWTTQTFYESLKGHGEKSWEFCRSEFRLQFTRPVEFMGIAAQKREPLRGGKI